MSEGHPTDTRPQATRATALDAAGAECSDPRTPRGSAHRAPGSTRGADHRGRFRRAPSRGPRPTALVADRPPRAESCARSRPRRARPAIASRRPHCHRPVPVYSSRTVVRASSANRRAAGRTCVPAAIDCRKYRRTVLRATPIACAIVLLPTPRLASARIAVTISSSITGTSAAGDTRTPSSSSIRPSSEGVRISVARGSISLSLYTQRRPTPQHWRRTRPARDAPGM